MAIRTYKVTLDSKNSIAPEPVYLRQGDKTGAVVIDATLLDNGSPVSLSGLTPSFMANTADGKAVVSDTTGFSIVDAPGGEFTYQVPSQLGSVDGKIKIAYFSFSDSSGVQSTFNVVFVVERAADMTQKSAKDWVSNLNDIISQYNQWVNNAHSSWQDFVNANKEIIESIDPGGIVLSELIRSRKPAGADVSYKDLPERLDKQIGLNSDFRAFEIDSSFMKRVSNEFTERGVNVKWFGAKGDGVTDDTLSIQSAINTGLSIFLPPGKYNVKELNGFASGQIIQGISKVESWGEQNAQNITVLNGIGSADNYVIKNNVWENGILPTAIAVKNLTIEGSKKTNGILVGNSSTIEGVKIKNCINGLSNIKVSNVMNCQINGCTNGVMNATDSKITNNFIYYNEVGIKFDNSNDNSIVNNKIEWNGIGISINKGVFNLISSNIIDRSTTYGIYTTNTTNTTITGNQFERNLTNHLYLGGALFNISTNSFFRKNSEDDQSGTMVPDVAIFIKSVGDSNIANNIASGKMFNTTGTDYISNVNQSDNIINGINPDNIPISVPETTVVHGKDTKIIVPLPSYFDGALKNPYNVEILHQKIMFTLQGGNFYSIGDVIKAIYVSTSGIELTIFNTYNDDLKITGTINVRCPYPNLY